MKSRRNLRKRHAKTKRRRQRGGKQFNVGTNAGKSYFLNLPEKPTGRQMLEAFLGQRPGMPPFSHYETLDNPPFTFLTQERQHIKLNSWNTPYDFPTRVKVVYHREKNQGRQQASETAAALPILLSLLDCLYQRFGFSKLSEASAATSRNSFKDIKKNVNQQFKFHKFPQNPIVLYDRDFFNPSSAQYDNFYTLLQFEQLTQEQVQSLFRELKKDLAKKAVVVQNESSSGPGGKASINQEQIQSRLERDCSPPPPGPLIQYFFKPEGVPFTISEGGNEAFKQAYLQEVQKQAAASKFNEMQPLLIVVVKYFSTPEGIEQLKARAAETKCEIYIWED